MGPKFTWISGAIRRVFACAAVLLAATLWLPGAAQAQVQVVINGKMVLVEDLGLTKVEDMDFGNIIPDTGGTVVMDPTETATCTETGTVIHTGECQPATFAGFGTPGNRIRIRVPPGGDITLTNATGDTMDVTDMTINGDPSLNITKMNPRTFRANISDPTGIFTFRVGGILNVGSGQRVGTYTATFDVDVQYF